MPCQHLELGRQAGEALLPAVRMNPVTMCHRLDSAAADSLTCRQALQLATFLLSACAALPEVSPLPLDAARPWHTSLLGQQLLPC